MTDTVSYDPVADSMYVKDPCPVAKGSNYFPIFVHLLLLPFLTGELSERTGKWGGNYGNDRS